MNLHDEYKLKKDLTQRQKMYIKANHARMSPGEMATNLGLKTEKEKMLIIDYMDEEDLPARNVYQERAAPPENDSDEIFKHDKNWY